MSTVSTRPHLAPIADWAAGLTFEEIPDEVVARTKHVILNNLGCLLLGAESSGEKHREIPSLFGGPADESWCPAVPTKRAATTTAAMVNASMINGTELSEGLTRATVHPGTVMIPSVLGEAERIGASGKDALVALLAGYELLVRVGWATSHDPEQPLETVTAQTLFRGWYPPALLGAFGSAAGVCRLHGADGPTLLQALGIVAQLCPTTTLASFKQGVDAKSLGCGWATATGIVAARLAIEGFTGGTTGAEDLFPLLVERVDFGRLEAEMGDPWEIMSIDVKFVAAGPALCEIECAIQIREEYDFDVADVVKIDVEANARTMLLADKRPTTPSGAKFSVPYCIAQGLLGRSREEMMVEAFERDAVSASDWQTLAGCVSMTLNEEFERIFETFPPKYRPTKLILTLRDGSKIERRIEGALGIPGFPPPEKDFVRKYRYLARRSYTQEQIDAQVETILRVEELGDVRELMQLFEAEGR